MIHSGITEKTPMRIPFGAGVYFKGVKYDEKVAPTEEEVKSCIAGATQEGGTTTITPTVFNVEADGAKVKLKELAEKTEETALMEVSFIEVTPEMVKNQVYGKLGESTDKSFHVITSDDHLRPNHFYSGFGFMGYHLDGREMIIIFKNALCTSGHVAENKTKTNTRFNGTFECYSDIEYGVTKLPYAIFIRKEEGWKPVNADEVAAA